MSMTAAELKRCIALAEDFCAKADARLVEIEEGDCLEFVGTRKSGEARRASMALTRALADLRRAAS